jgi:hypothetical protein
VRAGQTDGGTLRQTDGPAGDRRATRRIATAAICERDQVLREPAGALAQICGPVD